MRMIDADALKDKLQQYHDFYVMAWGGFGKMPIGEKKRVDEITNCIAEIVNAPTIEPKQGEWIWVTPYTVKCSNCGKIINTKDAYCETFTDLSRTNANVFCRYCGTNMRQNEPQAGRSSK